MSIEIITEANMEGTSKYVLFPEMVCDVCQSSISKRNPGMVVYVVRKTHPAYHIHKGNCMNKLADDSTLLGLSTKAEWVADEVKDHLFRLLDVMGYTYDDDTEIVLKKPE